ncbi:hypothetical protein LCGC14_0734260 [marine sediment metagenome]|uniref:Uncharacterized protein n=1 Tax=marine sediment metagenome TaxID=412755 RepID=A0A0F9QCV4_9ZZZZ
MFDFLKDWTSWVLILVVGSLLGLLPTIGG